MTDCEWVSMATGWADSDTKLGDRLRYYREERGLSQRLLAERADVPRSYVGHLETGERTNPTLEVLLKLLYVLDVSLAEFFAPFTEVIDPFPS